MHDALDSADSRIEKSTKTLDANDQALRLRRSIERSNQVLLEHTYFKRCRAGLISRDQVIEIIKHLYSFSVCFERLLARRISEYSDAKDPRILALARQHMREEIGHAELFRACLEQNHVPFEEIVGLAPSTFTRALFGYLTVTIQHENEYVANVAIMQVMESIGYHFFSATLQLMHGHGMVSEAMAQHSQDDVEHANLGIDLVDSFDPRTMRACMHTIADIYRLMSLVLDEWLSVHRSASHVSYEAAAGCAE
jgi:hypothetical protein